MVVDRNQGLGRRRQRVRVAVRRETNSSRLIPENSGFLPFLADAADAPGAGQMAWIEQGFVGQGTKTRRTESNRVAGSLSGSSVPPPSPRARQSPRTSDRPHPG